MRRRSFLQFLCASVIAHPVLTAFGGPRGAVVAGIDTEAPVAWRNFTMVYQLRDGEIIKQKFKEAYDKTVFRPPVESHVMQAGETTFRRVLLNESVPNLAEYIDA